MAWNYTPRQLVGWAEFIARAKNGEQADLITAVAIGANPTKETKRMLRDMREET